MEKSEILSKPENTFDRGQNSSHTRALSDGHSIDVSSSGEFFRELNVEQKPIVEAVGICDD